VEKDEVVKDYLAAALGVAKGAETRP
jgi:hypothetical protein